jgi:methanogenic corrinoid protein MtbC1
MASKEEVLEKLKTGVVEYLEEQVKEAAQQGLDDGYNALELLWMVWQPAWRLSGICMTATNILFPRY